MFVCFLFNKSGNNGNNISRKHVSFSLWFVFRFWNGESCFRPHFLTFNDSTLFHLLPSTIIQHNLFIPSINHFINRLVWFTYYSMRACLMTIYLINGYLKNFCKHFIFVLIYTISSLFYYLLSFSVTSGFLFWISKPSRKYNFSTFV